MQFAMTREQLESIRTRLSVNGVQITGDSGEIEQQGCKLSYSYDGSNLTVNVLHKPFMIPESAVENKIKEWFHEPGI